MSKKLSPIKSGAVHYHYQNVYEEMGRKAARAEKSDSGFHWFLFTNTTEEDVKLWCRENGVERYYGGVGRYFSESPSIILGKNKILVKHSWGYDI